jgi:hypothetical protein
MAREIDSNIAHYERAVRELPSANLSITLPIVLIGLERDETTPVVDVRACHFEKLGDIIGKNNAENRWRVVHGYISGTDMATISADSQTGPMLVAPNEAIGAEAVDVDDIGL